MKCRRKLRPGDVVVWYRTLGGGGGSGKRPNAKEPTLAVVRKVRTRVQIEPSHRPIGWLTWVNRSSVAAFRPNEREP